LGNVSEGYRVGTNTQLIYHSAYMWNYNVKSYNNNFIYTFMM